MILFLENKIKYLCLLFSIIICLSNSKTNFIGSDTNKNFNEFFITTLSLNNKSLYNSFNYKKESNSVKKVKNNYNKTEEKLITYDNLEEKEYEEIIDNIEDNSSIYDTGFRSFMSYKSISKKSKQYNKVIINAEVKNNGFLFVDNDFVVVAIGNGWGLDIGDKAVVVTTENNNYKIIVGDIKSNVHTDKEEHKVTISNGCAVEFIVDTTKLPKKVKNSGNIATIDEYKGKVIDIVKY